MIVDKLYCFYITKLQQLTLLQRCQGPFIFISPSKKIFNLTRNSFKETHTSCTENHHITCSSGTSCLLY